MSDQTDLLQGTLDLLILRILALEPMHGWAIAQRIQQVSDELLRVQQGSLYPALHRLETQGWVQSEWGASDNNRRAKFYSLTKAGKKQLTVETSKWARLSAGVNLVLERSKGHEDTEKESRRYHQNGSAYALRPPRGSRSEWGASDNNRRAAVTRADSPSASAR